MKTLRLTILLAVVVSTAVANGTDMLMRVKTTEVTDHQVEVRPDGSKVSIFLAEHKDSDSGKMIYYKKVVDEAKRGQPNYKPEVFFRYSTNDAWQQLPQGCPAPEIKPKEGIDKCEKGWKIGKKMATIAAYLGLKKAEEDSGSGIQLGNQYTGQTGVPEELRTRKAVADTAAALTNTLQQCVKKTLKKTGFTVERVCLHKGLVAESSSLVNSLKNHAEDPKFNCDYSTLKEHGRCLDNSRLPSSQGVSHEGQKLTTGRRRATLG